MFWSGRIFVYSKMEVTSSTFYKKYFFLLIIKNLLFLNILVYYFPFFVIIAINKKLLNILKMLKHTVILILGNLTRTYIKYSKDNIQFNILSIILLFYAF